MRSAIFVLCFAVGCSPRASDPTPATGTDSGAPDGPAPNTFEPELETATPTNECLMTEERSGQTFFTRYRYYAELGKLSVETSASPSFVPKEVAVGTFDTELRLIRIVSPATIGALGTAYTYDEHGNLLRMTTLPEGAVHREFRNKYDERGRLTSRELVTEPGELTAYTYDPAGRLDTEWYDRDRDGLIDATTTFAYDTAGRRIRTTHRYSPDPATAPSSIAHISYDDVGRIVKVEHDGPPTVTSLSADGVIDQTTTWSYAGDALSEIKLGESRSSDVRLGPITMRFEARCQPIVKLFPHVAVHYLAGLRVGGLPQ